MTSETSRTNEASDPQVAGGMDPDATETNTNHPSGTSTGTAGGAADPAGVPATGAPAGEPPSPSRAQDRWPRLPAWLLPAGVVGLVVALPVWGLWIAPGPPMEEGFMLVFPERVLAGDVPNRDFLHLYGPGSLWFLAAVYQVLGVDLWVERLAGLGQIGGLVAGVTYAGYRWGRWVAVGAGTTAAVVIMPAIGLTALAWVGGVALGLWATIVAVCALDGDRRAEGTEEGRGDVEHDGGQRPTSRQGRLLFLGGLLGGVALLFRPDLVVALGLPFGAMWLWGLDRVGRWRLLSGVAAGVSPFLVHLAMAGPVNAFNGMVMEPVFDLRPGRSLGFPPSWDEYDSFLNKAFAWRDSPWPFPALPDTNQIFLWVPLLFLACALLVGVGVHARRAGSEQGWFVLALALFCVGTLPQAIQRPDSAHLAWVSAVPFALVPVALAEWFRLRRTSGSTAASTAGGGLRHVAAALAPLVAMLVVIPNFTVQWYVDYVGQTFGFRREGHAIEHRGRTFVYGRGEVAEAARALLADVEQVTQPGDVLIVGPGNFTFTPYSEVYLYFLLPQLEPGTRYIEMDPGVANAGDSDLADELREADVVILSTMYDTWDEPNTSREPGSPEPDRVLAEGYCLHGTYGANPAFEGRGFYELYLRC